MRKNVLTFLLPLAFVAGLNTQSSAQVLVDYWNFNVDSTVALTPTTSLVAGASLAYAGAYHDSVQQGTLLNGVGADGTSFTSASAALRLRNPASGPFTLTLPTTGYKNIVLKYAEQRTNKGSQQNIVTYSVDGTTWINTAIAANATYFVDSTDTISNAYQLQVFDFSSDTNVNNNANFKVRIVFAMGDTNSSGNDRFDNITLSGDTVAHSGTTGVALVAGAKNIYTLAPNPATNNLEINAVIAGDKSVMITNEIGQTVYTGTANTQRFNINTSALATGNYYISIRENATGKMTTLKFAKQ